MKKLLMFLFIGVTALCLVTGNTYAATITGYGPTINGATLDIVTLLSDANTTLAKYDNQKDLAKGFANANIYSSQVATFQGYQNYDLFAVTTGVMLGIQAPSFDPSYYDDLGDELEKEGDLDAGLGAGIAFVNVGLNAGFIMERLYLNFKFGSLKIKPDDDVTIKNSVIGIGANYGIIKGGGVGWGLIKWRGLSIGSGFIYHKSKLDYVVDLDKESQLFNDGGVQGTVFVDPSLNLGLEVETYTIPFDITTSFQLLWLLNLTVGAGIDFSFGKSDIILSSAGEVGVENITSGAIVTYSPGYIKIDGSTRDVAPSFVRPRLMAGLGLNLWKIKIDMPVIYYPTAGFAVGLTAGIVW